MTKSFFILLVFLNLNVLHSDYVYPYREISKPPHSLPNNMRIFQCSPARTGSTLIYNILQYLFEDKLEYHLAEKKVAKAHEIDSLKDSLDDVYIVSTIRNPLDALASRLYSIAPPIGSKIIKFNRNTLEINIEKVIAQYKKHYAFFQNSPKNRTLVLKYELFADNYNYIYSELENFFHITLTDESKRSMNKYFNRKSIKKISSKYNSFKGFDPYLGIHGNHINNVDWKVNIPKKYHEYLLERFRDILILFDYPLSG